MYCVLAVSYILMAADLYFADIRKTFGFRNAGLLSNWSFLGLGIRSYRQTITSVSLETVLLTGIIVLAASHLCAGILDHADCLAGAGESMLAFNFALAVFCGLSPRPINEVEQHVGISGDF